MRLTIRVLVLVGTPLLAIGLAYLLLLSAFACGNGCSESQNAAAVAERATAVAPFTILSAVPVSVAWILCIAQLVRAGRRRVAVALALALPLVAALSVWFYHDSTAHTWLPSHLARINLYRLVGLPLLWPVATFVATFALHRS